MCYYCKVLKNDILHGYVLNEYLGKGKSGEAYITQDGFVLKITSEEGEYQWAKTMIGHKCKHVVDVYDTWKCTLDNDDIFFICEEKLDTKSIDYNTRHNVFEILDNVLYNQHRSRQELSMLLSNDTNHTFETRARMAFKNYRKEEYVLNSLLDAYIESVLINPRIELDLSANNFGVSTDGTIKVFDCSIPKEITYRTQNKDSDLTFKFNIILEHNETLNNNNKL